ncbi:MAG: glycerol dehydrogenase [Bacteroidales bacterium]|jgi:glycerol dehydrogenase|nr:glycerol dehydrogenase [Bacteroidales bacterium]NLH23856.1 glycerol dehydrogenase [Bacteroidales bacterium]
MIVIRGHENIKEPLKAVFPGKYIQGRKALSDLPYILDLMGDNGLVLASPSVISNVLPKYSFIENRKKIHVETFGGECCIGEVERITGIVHQNKADVIVGMGGGKVIDTAKIVADKAGIPVIVVPTIASTDAPTSGCAVLYSPEGVFDSVYYLKMNPQAVLVDETIIASAPTRFLVSGMGDALATWFEARSCKRSGSSNECGGYTTLTAMGIARLCYQTLLRYGLQAKKDCDLYLTTPALSYIIEANVLMSGLGFESCGLASAHAIHNGLTVLEEAHAFYHGEKVAFGVLAGLHLTGAPVREKDSVYDFCESVGLPTTFEDLNLNRVSRKRLMEAAVKTCHPSEAIHHETRRITPEEVLTALLAADDNGKKRKQGTYGRKP